MLRKNKFFQLWLITGIITGFAAVIFFSIIYLNNNVLCSLDCKLKNEVFLLLVLLSLFGMFIGSLTYYFISDKYERKITKIHKDASKTLNFLDGEEKTIVRSIINRKGEITQSAIAKDTGLSRVKISRSLKKLEQKNVIIKVPKGMTNIIKLEEDIFKVMI